MSKAARIRELLDAGWTPTAIAQHLGCHDAYVRTVRQRQEAGGLRECEKRWRAENAEHIKATRRRWHSEKMQDAEYAARMRAERLAGEKRRMQDPAYRERKRALALRRQAERYRTDPEFRERQKAAARRSREARRVAHV